MTQDNDAIKKEFVRAISSLIDEHSGKDYELMRKLEDFTWSIFVLLDGCRPDDAAVFLTTAAFTKDIISGNLHHDIIRCRLFKNPARRDEMRESVKKYIGEIKKKRDQKSSGSSLSNHHSSNSSSIVSSI